MDCTDESGGRGRYRGAVHSRGRGRGLISGCFKGAWRHTVHFIMAYLCHAAMGRSLGAAGLGAAEGASSA